MTQNTKGAWQTAAELFAMSILEICPKIIFKTIKADFLGFVCEYILDEPLHKDHIDLAITRMKEKVKKKVKIEVLEMVSTNVIDYMKHQKQPLRARAVNTAHQFTKVVKIDHVYADVLDGEIEKDLKKLQVIEVSMPKLIGEELFRKQKTPLYQIKGLAFSSTQELKDHKKACKEGSKFDHRQVPFEGEKIALWRSVYDQFAKALVEEGYVEEWRGSDLKKGRFAEYDEETGVKDEFGLKSNGFFRGIKFRLINASDEEKLKAKLLKTLPVKSDIDVYGIKWPLIEFSETGKIWIDRIVALLIESRI